MNNPLSFSSNILKFIACATMLVDHVGFLFFPDNLLWRVVGRISFPLFAFLIAEGFYKSRNVEKYFLRLLLFGVISQIPYGLFIQAVGLSPELPNIFFTLAAGLLCLMLWRRLPRVCAYPFIALLLFFAEYFSFDYGAYGIILILASAFLLNYHRAGAALLYAIHCAKAVWAFFAGYSSIQIFAALSVPILACYSGERGRSLPRYLFYSFYPVHLCILWLIWLVLQ